jgi:endonuclease/exonuclease/phosphatase family metal-dependent hydrolase
MTYNVHGCRGHGRRPTSVEQVAAAIAEQSPDVIALQEVDVRRTRSGAVDQAQALAAILGMEHCFSPAMSWSDAHYGNAVLSRFPMRVLQRWLLPRPRGWPVEPRSALAVELDAPGGVIRLVNTHLGLLAFERLAQIRALLVSPWLQNDQKLILCGDLNSRPGSRELRLLRAHLTEALPTPEGITLSFRKRSIRLARVAHSYPVALPFWRLDHLLHSAQVRVESCRVPRTALNRDASDHLPMIVDCT